MLKLWYLYSRYQLKDQQKKKKRKETANLTNFTTGHVSLYNETDIRNVQSDEAQALSVQESLQL